MLTDQPLRWACLLDLGDERDTPLIPLCLDRMQEAARRIVVADRALQRRERHPHFRFADLLALVSLDLAENISHRSPRRGKMGDIASRGAAVRNTNEFGERR